MSKELIIVFVVQGFTLLGSIIAGVMSYKAQGRKIESEQDNSIAEAVAKIVEANKKTMDNMMAEINRLESELNGVRAEFKIWKTGTRKLIRQLEDLEIEPSWRPPR